jgi:hypothetical protein
MADEEKEKRSTVLSETKKRKMKIKIYKNTFYFKYRINIIVRIG